MANYGITVVTAPTAEPVTPEEAKVQCELAVGVDHFDGKLATLIAAARQKVEADTGRALMTQTLDFTTDYFPVGLDAIYLPRSPVASITHVKYYDTAGVQQTLATSVYKTILDREPPEIRLKASQSWTSLYSEDAVVTVRMVCGYTSSTAVPAALKQAVLLYVHHLFDPDTARDIEDAYKSLISTYTVGDEFHCYAR